MPTIIYGLLLLYYWHDLTFIAKKYSIVCLYLIVVRLDNNIVLKALIYKENNYELISTIILIVSYFINSDY